MMNIFNWGIGDIISGLALTLSAYATVMTIRFNHRQKELIMSQEKLNKALLAKEEGEALAAKKAELGATLIKIGKNYRLKIWNQGKSPAHNVKLDFPEENDWFGEEDINSKFPLESLDMHQSVELYAHIYLENRRTKHAIKLIWGDDSGETNEKILYVTL